MTLLSNSRCLSDRKGLIILKRPMREASLLQRFSTWQSNESELSIVKPKSVGLFPFTSLLSSTVTTSSLLILDARRFPVIVKTLDFDSLIGSLFESAQWRISSAEIFSESLSSGKLLKWADAATATRLHQIRRRPFAEVFHPFHYTQHCCIFSKTIANWHAASPMDSCHGNPSPSDPMESVTDIFHPFHYSTLLYVF